MPRTDTSDAAAALEELVYRFGSWTVSAPGTDLYTNSATNNLKIVTGMDVCCINSGEGQYIAVGLRGAGLGGTFVIFGAMTGAGFYDTFSYRGQFAVDPGQVLTIYDVSGTWHVHANGYQSIVPVVG